MPTTYSAHLLSNIQIAKDTYELTFETVGDFIFKPGQYIWLILPKLDVPDPRGNRRAFSIASSAENKNIFSIIFRSGISSYKKGLTNLSKGDEIAIRGPMGSSLLVENFLLKSLYLIGGGVGSAPFISIVRSYSTLPQKLNITFINLNSEEEKKFLIEEMNKLSSKFGFKFMDEMGRMEPKWIESAPDYRSAMYFVCGQQGFVNDVYDKLKTIGVSDVNMRFEEHYPMRADSFQPLVNENHKSGFELAAESSSNHIIITDTNGTILFANEAASIITGYSKSEMLGQTPRLWGGNMAPEFYKNMWITKKSGKPFVGEFTNTRKDGTTYIAFARISPIFNTKKEIVGYVGTEEDITKAKEIDRMKSDFISLASHQLRTPLSAMRWLLEMVLGGDAGVLTNTQLEYIKNIDASNQRMIDLVNQLLDISRLESGKILPQPSPTDLKQLVSGVVAQIKEKADENTIQLSPEIDPNLPLVLMDSKLITQVFLNLIDNAIKYSPAGGKVRILVGANKDSIVSQIIDTGIGIPESQKSRIYDKFFRADNAIRLNSEGTGLGLYLAKDIVEASGGKIWFESTEDKGTTFFFSLPLHSAVTKNTI